ncbi:hypothetical protein CFP56_016648 [Quercus suber]|uniref:Protein SirB1 N-terminal domain-containing protein n=1 Tax=Quercus suber TaxID=58331 RepID=A0AAW0KQ38_QUESU
MSSLLGSSAAATSSPWIPIRRPSFLISTTPPPSKFFKFHSFSPSPSSSSRFRVVCSSGGTEGSSSSSSDAAAREFKFVLHDALESSGIHASHARGFRRTHSRNQSEPRALYLHSVLTHRSGSIAMLSLIYSELLKMLRMWGLVDFDVEIFFPHDLHSLPRGYDKQKSKESDQPHIITSQTLLLEILRNLKNAFWPFQHDHTRSLFLWAAHAANCIDKSNIAEEESGFQLASAKAARHRLERGVWTSVRFGDMRRALSACERLILLDTEAKELRDYSILLYHCGFFEESLQYLKLYQDTKDSSLKGQSADSLSSLEEDAVEKLMIRLNLILMEEGWSKPSHVRNYIGNNSEPW